MPGRNLTQLLLAAAVAVVGSAGAALAHGTNIEVSRDQVQIRATYDSGEPMQNAQVRVYSPENLEEPWAEGVTDDQGQFSFAPDPQQPGSWEVTVRQAGHGDVATIPVGEVPTDSAPVQEASLSPVQQWVTIGAVIWGFIGTALFFSRSKR